VSIEDETESRTKIVDVDVENDVSFKVKGSASKRESNSMKKLIRVQGFRGQSWVGWSKGREGLHKARNVEGFKEGCKAGGRSGRIS
jgi:hypothetical protein